MKISQKGIWLGAAGLVVVLCATATVARHQRKSLVYASNSFARSGPEREHAAEASRPIDSPTQPANALPVNGDFNPVNTTVPDSSAEATQSSNSAAPLTRGGAVAAEPVQVQPPEPHIPAPFLPLPNARNWNVDDSEAVASLAKQFTDAVVGPSQSPLEPEYYNRWMDAQRLANERYRSYFGYEAYNALRDPGE